MTIVDYARQENREAWFRHPTLGDPSFDAFEKVGETVHRSEAPYEWAVNGSLFRDPRSGRLFCFVGLYPEGYAIGGDSAPWTFRVYRSDDDAATWVPQAGGFPEGFRFQGHEAAADHVPDVVMAYDPEEGRYWLCYDWCERGFDWSRAHGTPGPGRPDSGAALAWSMAPEGPYVRLETPFFSNREHHGRLGRFTRGYAATLVKRDRDWAAFLLCDSGDRFAWGLACMTAATPEGPWTDPVVLLSCDRTGYYPAPVEFHPCFVYDGRVFAPATSVSRNRNYQAVFAADLETAHEPSAWDLVQDGGFWHARDLPDERFGLWGQTVHGFVHDGAFTVMYPSRDDRGRGAVSIARRRADAPFRDGFAFSGHDGPSLSPLLCAYRDFRLSVDLSFRGEVGIVFGYDGILGPDHPGSDAVPHRQALASCHVLFLADGGGYRLVRIEGDSGESVLLAGTTDAPVRTLVLDALGGTIRVSLDGRSVGAAPYAPDRPLPLAVRAGRFSWLRCDRFEVEGETHRASLRFGAAEAVLGAGGLEAYFPKTPALPALSDERYATSSGRGKWNFRGDAFEVWSPRSPDLGILEVSVDGVRLGTASLRADSVLPSAPVFRSGALPSGRHAVEVRSAEGTIALDVLVAHCGRDAGSVVY